MRTVPFTLVLVLAVCAALLGPTPSPLAGFVVAAALVVRLATRYGLPHPGRRVSTSSRAG